MELPRDSLHDKSKFPVKDSVTVLSAFTTTATSIGTCTSINHLSVPSEANSTTLSNGITNDTASSAISETHVLGELSPDKLRELRGLAGDLVQFEGHDGRIYSGVTERDAAVTSPGSLNAHRITLRFEILKVLISATRKTCTLGEGWDTILARGSGITIPFNRIVFGYLNRNTARLILAVQGYYRDADAHGITGDMLSLSNERKCTTLTPQEIQDIESTWNSALDACENLSYRFRKLLALLKPGKAPPRRPRGDKQGRKKPIKRRKHIVESDDELSEQEGGCKRAKTMESRSTLIYQATGTGVSSRAEAIDTVEPQMSTTGSVQNSLPTLSASTVTKMQNLSRAILPKFEKKGKIYWGVEERDARIVRLKDKDKSCSLSSVITRGKILWCILESEENKSLPHSDSASWMKEGWYSEIPGYNTAYTRRTTFYVYFYRNMARLILALQGYYECSVFASKEIYKLNYGQGGQAFDPDIAEIENYYDKQQTPVKNLWRRHELLYRKLIELKVMKPEESGKRRNRKSNPPRQNTSRANRSTSSSPSCSSRSTTESECELHSEGTFLVKRLPPRATKPAVGTLRYDSPDHDDNVYKDNQELHRRVRQIIATVSESAVGDSHHDPDLTRFMCDVYLPFVWAIDVGEERSIDAILGFLFRIQRGGVLMLQSGINMTIAYEFISEGIAFRESGPDEVPGQNKQQGVAAENKRLKEWMEGAAADLFYSTTKVGVPRPVAPLS